MNNEINQLHLNIENDKQLNEISETKLNNERLSLIEQLNKQEFNYTQLIVELKNEKEMQKK